MPSANLRCDVIETLLLLAPLLVAVTVRGELWPVAVCFGVSELALWAGIGKR
jgi:hypothetical protein